MGGMLNKDGYQKLIDENIEALEKHMPKHSLEKKHTIEVLKWSIKQIYERKGNKPETSASGLNLAIVITSGLCDAEDHSCKYFAKTNNKCNYEGFCMHKTD
jgi:hypothetical protein